MLAYWIDPRGRVIKVPITHIATVIKHPTKFGLTKAKIQKAYDKHNEKIGWEGKAREEIMIDLMKKGFIRIRERSKGWSVQLWKLNKKMNDYLWMWAHEILPTAFDKFGEVEIWELNRMGSRPSVSVSLDDLASGKSVKEGNDPKKFIEWIEDDMLMYVPDFNESDCIDWDAEDKFDKYLIKDEESKEKTKKTS